MASVRGQGRLARRGQAFEAPIGLLSNKCDDRDHEDPLESNEPGLSKAPARPEAPTRPEAPVRPPQAPLFSIAQDSDAN